MANTSFTRTYTDFATATVDRYCSKKFEDNISRASPFLSWMMDDGGKVGRGDKKYMSGDSGDRIMEPLMTELNTTGKWYDGAEEFDTTQQNVGTAAFWDSKQLGITITITGKDKRLNSGKEKQIDLLKARSDQGMISMRTLLARATIAGDGTGSSGKEIYGVPALCPTDRGTTVAYGEIAANTSWWLCQRSRSGTTYGAVGDFATNFKKYGKQLYHDCQEGGSAPDLHLVSQEAEESYHDLLLPFERHESKTALDLGYENVLTFMKAAVLWDRYHPYAGLSTQNWYMLNSEFLRLRYCPEANFSVLGFQRPIAGDYISTPVIWQGALTTNSRRMHGVLTGITGVV